MIRVFPVSHAAVLFRKIMIAEADRPRGPAGRHPDLPRHRFRLRRDDHAGVGPHPDLWSRPPLSSTASRSS
ncbi:MAG: hypothetical protein MZU97_09625 [Bacillus subtilis]|nr:hypothetical protein [Bacillus subtilis]